MKTFQTSIHISASPSRVWGILTDLSHWTSWNTTVEKVTGQAALGAKVTVYAKASPGRAFPLKVTEIEAPRRMVWTGGMPSGLFVGKRTYVIEPESDGVRFEMNEQFTGFLAPLITKSIPDLQPSFDEFAQCLKRIAETQT
jgi:hypothetical protein